METNIEKFVVHKRWSGEVQFTAEQWFVPIRKGIQTAKIEGK
jgi:hypothetical protein